jgi:3-oxoacyl-[acyl-carrier-protein] synthase II
VIGVSAWSVHLPGAGLGLPGDAAEPPDRAHELLGRKGLLYKDDATRLALCAVHRALGLDRRAPRPAGPADPATAVVVSSNLGNVGVVREIVETVRAGSGHDVSPMLAPGASSNVIAAALAIRFRFGGPNLTVCSGATGGLDAIAAAALLLRARRAHRVIVVGVEPADEVAQSLHRHRSDGAGRPLRAGAACVVLERDGAVALGPVESFDPEADPVAGPVIGTADCAKAGAEVRDLGAEIGDTYGAAGVLGVALAAARPSREWTVVDGSPGAGWRRVVVGVDR